MYSILIRYQTGNSYGTYETEAEVGLNWESLDRAKHALAYIQEHYRAYCKEDLSKWTHKASVAFVDSIKSRPWFYGGKYPEQWKNGLKVEDDSGELRLISAFWIGYFENLISAKIIVAGSDDMEFTV